jgi:hypothetical protein
VLGRCRVESGVALVVVQQKDTVESKITRVTLSRGGAHKRFDGPPPVRRVHANVVLVVSIELKVVEAFVAQREAEDGALCLTSMVAFEHRGLVAQERRLSFLNFGV